MVILYVFWFYCLFSWHYCNVSWFYSSTVCSHGIFLRDVVMAFTLCYRGTTNSERSHGTTATTATGAEYLLIGATMMPQSGPYLNETPPTVVGLFEKKPGLVSAPRMSCFG